MGKNFISLNGSLKKKVKDLLYSLYMATSAILSGG